MRLLKLYEFLYYDVIKFKFTQNKFEKEFLKYFI